MAYSFGRVKYALQPILSTTIVILEGCQLLKILSFHPYSQTIMQTPWVIHYGIIYYTMEMQALFNKKTFGNKWHLDVIARQKEING